MKIEIILIGDELLSGRTRDKNGVYLASSLTKLGFATSRITTLSDDKAQLFEGLSQALERSELVICCGGLGPTLDDHTRDVVTDLFEDELVVDDVVAHELKRRFTSDFPKVKDQCLVPGSGYVFLNTVGTAPAFLLEKETKKLIVLPGVPSEFRCLCDEQVLPWIERNIPVDLPFHRKTVTIGGVGESEINPLLENMEKGYPDLKIGIYPQLGLVNVELAALSGEVIDLAVSELEAGFGDRIVFSESGRIEDALQAMMVQKGLTLATAESCTGGMVSQLVTSVPGASCYFLGGVVVYSNHLKEKILGVSEEVIKEHGAVSEPVVALMAEGLFEKTEADWVLATSGIAGPGGGTEEKPVGMVCCAMGQRGKKMQTWTIQHYRASREMIIEKSARSLLFSLYQSVRTAAAI